MVPSEYDDESYGVEALTGSASNDGPPGPAAELLLDVIGSLARLHTLLLECDEADYAALSGRLEALRALTTGLPETPRVRRAIGFTPRGQR